MFLLKRSFQACNLVMAMTFEYRGHPEEEAVRRERRMVGTVVVPGKHITRIEISEDALR
jgi:hypothetical protein